PFGVHGIPDPHEKFIVLLDHCVGGLICTGSLVVLGISSRSVSHASISDLRPRPRQGDELTLKSTDKNLDVRKTRRSGKGGKISHNHAATRRNDPDSTVFLEHLKNAGVLFQDNHAVETDNVTGKTGGFVQG